MKRSACVGGGEPVGDPRQRRCGLVIGLADMAAHARKLGVRPGEADEGEVVIARHGHGEQPVAHEQPGAVRSSIEAAPVGVVHAARGRLRVVGLRADHARKARPLAVGADDEPGPDRLRGPSAVALDPDAGHAAVFDQRLDEAHGLAQLGAGGDRGIRQHRVEQVAARRIGGAGPVGRRRRTGRTRPPARSRPSWSACAGAQGFRASSNRPSRRRQDTPGGLDEMARHGVAGEAGPVDHEDLEPLARQHQGEGGSGTARADDSHVVHGGRRPFRVLGAR